MRTNPGENVTGSLTSPTSAEHDNAPLFPLPNELNLHILRFFSSNDLHRSLALVNKDGYRLASTLQVERLRRILGHSELWRCLPVIAGALPDDDHGGALQQYVARTLNSDRKLPADWLRSLRNLPSFLECWVAKLQIPLVDLGLGVASAADIQAKANALMTMMNCQENAAAFAACENFKDFINLANNQNLLAVCQQYDDLDRIFSSLLLLMLLSVYEARNRSYYLISNPSLYRGLTAEVLAAVRRMCTPNLERSLLQEGMRIHNLPSKEPKDENMLSWIDSFLAQLGVGELLKFELTPEYPHLFRELVVIPYLLRSPRLLRQLSNDALIGCLNRIKDEDIEQVIRMHPAVYPFLTFDVIKAWVETCITLTRSEFVKIILTQNELLVKLNHDRIVSLTQYLTGSIRFGKTDFSGVLEHSVFREKLEQDPERGSLLMRIATETENSMLGIDIALDHEAALMLSPDEVIQLLKISPCSREHFGKRADVLCKFSSTQLYDQLRIYMRDFYQTIYDRLDLFTNEDLTRVATAYLDYAQRKCFPDSVPLLLEKFGPELARRASLPDAEKLTSQHWLRLCSAAPELYVLIANRYVDQLPKNEISVNAQLKIRGEATDQKAPVGNYSQENLSRHFVNQPSFRSTSIENSWATLIETGLLYLIAFCGILLLLTGVASGVGYPLAISAANFLFSALPFSTTLACCCVGLIALIIPAIYLAYDSAADLSESIMMREMPVTPFMQENIQSLYDDGVTPYHGNTLFSSRAVGSVSSAWSDSDDDFSDDLPNYLRLQ